jgi:hypothetical protein
MMAAQRVLILTGLFLIACTMAFGVGYAIFDEHQTLVGMGTQMATGFMQAAAGDMDAAYAALDSYGAISTEYRYEVHSHGHWGMLALILIVIGLVFQRLGLPEGRGLALAWLLALSAALFPLGVLLQIGPAAGLGKLLVLPASSGMILGLLITVWTLLREPSGGSRL